MCSLLIFLFLIECVCITSLFVVSCFFSIGYYIFSFIFWVGCIIICLVAEKVWIENLSGSRFKPSERVSEIDKMGG